MGINLLFIFERNFYFIQIEFFMNKIVWWVVIGCLNLIKGGIKIIFICDVFINLVNKKIR